MKRSVIHLGEDLEYTRSSAALSEHNRSGPKSRRARCSLAVTARSGVNGGGCVVAREAWKKEGRRHGSKRMVTCDRHCEATERPLSMPARLCAFLLPRKRPLSLYLSLFPGFDDRLCRRLRLRFSGPTPENRFASLKAPVERSRARARPISLQTWLLSRCLKVRTATNHFVTVLPRSLPPLFLSSLLSAFWRARVCASIGWDFVASLG